MPKGIPSPTGTGQPPPRDFHQIERVCEKRFPRNCHHEIVKSAGLGKSTLYDYFKTKDEILLYFFEDQNHRTDEAPRIALQNIAADERLARW